MQRKSLGETQCPIARSLDLVGEWWSILILRDAFAGFKRFDEFATGLGIAPSMLTRRLNALVEAGLLERKPYSAHPPRHEYHLTERGRDFAPVLVALLAWGNKHLAPEGASLQIVDAQTGAVADPVLVDGATMRPLVAPDYRMVAGPAARSGMRQRLASPERGGLIAARPREPVSEQRTARKRVRSS